jgi:hypothetical protein
VGAGPVPGRLGAVQRMEATAMAGGRAGRTVLAMRTIGAGATELLEAALATLGAGGVTTRAFAPGAISAEAVGLAGAVLETARLVAAARTTEARLARTTTWRAAGAKARVVTPPAPG